MWKKLTVSLAAAALAAGCPLTADDSSKSQDCCRDGKKDASCAKMAEQCAMPGKGACCTHKRVVKITPVRKASESDPGFFAIVEEYSVTTEIPAQAANCQTPESGKAEHPAK